MQYDQNYKGDFRKGSLKECKITEVRILEVDIGVDLRMITLEEVEVCLENDSTQVTLGVMIEAVVDQDQDQECLTLRRTRQH